MPSSLCQENGIKVTSVGERWSQVPSFLDKVGTLTSLGFSSLFGGRGVVPSCGLTQRHINCVNCISYYQVCGERLEIFVTA